MDKLSGMEQTVNEIRDALKKRSAGSSGSNNSNTINMGSGERGIWICVCISMVTTAVVALGSMWMSREFNRYDIALSERKEESDRAQTYLSSIYGRMPQWMREEVEKESSAKLEAKGNKNAER